MGLFELAMFVSVVIALYNLQQIKMILKEKGYVVDLLTGWYRDYQQFKRLARTEKDQKAKLKYQRILNGLHFSLGGFFFFAAMIMRNRL